ncbi:MAG: hypothetical protein HY291_23415 [Planctomycetes bacterium]|nr:hypothetical protein [Planctomycetota bacterium]
MIAEKEAAAPGAVAEEPCCPTAPETEGVELPKLHLLVPGAERNIADLVVPLVALIVGPAHGEGAKGTLHYFEAACSSSATAHAVAGALVEHRLEVQLSVKWPGEKAEWQFVAAPEHVRIQDAKLTVAGWDRYLHHVAVLDPSGDLLVADSDGALWRKLRARMALPTLEGWGERLLPEIKKSGLLQPTRTYGLAEGLAAFVLAPDAAETFDRIVSAYVRVHGLTASAPPVNKRPARAALRRAS